MSAAPPASGPQEAATPVEALAARLEALAVNARALAVITDHPYYQGAGDEFRACASFVRDLAPAWDALAAERDKLSRSCQLLGRVVDGQARALYAARIDVLRGDYAAAKETLLVNTEDVLELHTWDGAETGAEWYERTREDGDDA